MDTPNPYDELASYSGGLTGAQQSMANLCHGKWEVLKFEEQALVETRRRLRTLELSVIAKQRDLRELERILLREIDPAGLELGRTIAPLPLTPEEV